MDVQTSRVKRIWVVISCGAAVAVFGLGLPQFLGEQRLVAAAAQEWTPPYTVRTVERAIDADGRERYRFEKTYARRADNVRVVAEHRYYQSPEGRPLELRVKHVSDPHRGLRVSVYPDVAGKVTVGLRPEAVEALKSSTDASCAAPGFEVQADPGRTEILGHAVVRRERRLESTDGQQVGPEQVEWVAPGLGCLALRSELRAYEQDGALRGTVVREAMGVDLGVPAVDLFAVDGGMVEMMPSQILTAQNRLQGLDCSKCDETAAANGDRMYLANRPQE